MTVEGKIALVTGPTGGVGRRVAERLARTGVTLLVFGRDAARAEQLCGEIQRAGGRAVFYRADLASLAEVRALADTVRRHHGQLDLLINNAGLGVGQLGTTAGESRRPRTALCRQLPFRLPAAL